MGIETVAVLLLVVVTAANARFVKPAWKLYQDESDKPYTPIVKFAGNLPKSSGQLMTYDVCTGDNSVPKSAKFVLVYLWATTWGHRFQRMYYEIKTSDGKTSYLHYMNIASSLSVVLNSDNIWLPFFGENCKIEVKLIGTKPANGKKVIKKGQMIILGHSSTKM